MDGHPDDVPVLVRDGLDSAPHVPLAATHLQNTAPEVIFPVEGGNLTTDSFSGFHLVTIVC